jgi:septal ring factor EnvC (AmiA/AmiB activator)
MRLLSAAALLLSVATAVPMLSQQTSSSDSTAAAPAANASTPTPDHTALRSGLAQQNKLLQDQVEQQRTILKLNEELIKETQKLDDASKRLEDEKAKVSALTSDLDKRRDALKASEKQGGASDPGSNSDSTVAQNATTSQN